MILYTFTTDGGDREDGNVYYSPVMAVTAHPLIDGQAVENVILRSLSVFGATKIGRDIELDRHGANDEYIHEGDGWMEVVKQALLAAGYWAEFPPMNYIVAS